MLERLEKADKYVKRIQRNAEYMVKMQGYTKLYYPCNDQNAEIDLHKKVINGKLYDSIYTNNYQYLVDFYKEETDVQLELDL